MFNKRTKIKEVLDIEPQSQEITVMGWVRTFRNNQFIALNDGSTNNTELIILQFRDDRIRYIRNAVNKGNNIARNELLKAEVNYANARLQVWRSLLAVAVAKGNLDLFTDQLK